MADRKLRSNVYVEGDEFGRGQWYGPDYPDNEVTKEVADKITNPAAWEVTTVVGSGDLRFRADDFAASGELDKDGSPPNLRARAEAAAAAASPVRDERAELEKLDKDELLALAEARQVEVKKSASKPEIIERLTGKGN
jgi:hypothetical protein